MALDKFNQYLQTNKEIGYVEEVIHAIAHVSGLPTAKPGELVIFDTGEYGQVVGIDHHVIEVLSFSKQIVRVGQKVAKTNKEVQVPVGKELLGQIINPLGFSLDVLHPAPTPKESRSLEHVAGGIATRKAIDESFETGTSIVDMMVPLGYGQRELVLGDRKTGKTTFLLQAMVNQAKYGIIGIYAAIGKKQLDIKYVEKFLRDHGVMDQSLIIASTSQDPAGIVHITPYAAMTIAEYFRDQGMNVFLVLDDLLNHAKYYREIALLSKKFPGRNAYPGDIFYAHARLLERAGNYFMDKEGKTGASITCLAVAETSQGDLSGYIQTNLMSMTDGHIYFDADLFTKGRRPAVNPFVSVTRVGRQTQTTFKRDISRELLSFMTLYDRMESFAHFSSEASPTVKRTLAVGEKITAFFNQTTIGIISSELQLFLFCLLWTGAWDEVNSKEMMGEIEKLVKAYRTNKTWQKQVDDLIHSAKNFNSFLKTIEGVSAMYKKPKVGQTATTSQQTPQTTGQQATPAQTPPANGAGK